MRKFTKDSTTYFAKGPACRRNFQKMRSESSENVRSEDNGFLHKRRIKIASESHFEEHAKEVW